MVLNNFLSCTIFDGQKTTSVFQTISTQDKKWCCCLVRENNFYFCHAYCLQFIMSLKQVYKSNSIVQQELSCSVILILIYQTQPQSVYKLIYIKKLIYYNILSFNFSCFFYCFCLRLMFNFSKRRKKMQKNNNKTTYG